MEDGGYGSGTALERKFLSSIPFLGIVGPQSQFPHSCVCEGFAVADFNLLTGHRNAVFSKIAAKLKDKRNSNTTTQRLPPSRPYLIPVIQPLCKLATK
jgi:hypothetical protein